MRASELTQKFRLKGEICPKSDMSKRWRILGAYDTYCYIKEVGGDDYMTIDYDMLDRDWTPYKRKSKKVIPTTVNDKFGNELHVGDEVYYACGGCGYSRSHEIEKGVIDGFTEKMVSISGFLTSADKIGKVFVKEGELKGRIEMTADECIDRITEVLSRDITISNGPNFQIDGRSTNIIFPGGKESLGRLFEIGNIIKEYKKEGN